MGLTVHNTLLSELSGLSTIRLWAPLILPKTKYRYEKVISYLDSCESGSRPEGGIKNEDFGQALSLGCEQINVDGTVDLTKKPFVSFDFYESVNKGNVRDKDILLCKDGALTGKSCKVISSLIPQDEVLINEHIFILRGNEKVVQEFLYYFTRTNIFLHQVQDLAFRKKGQPGLNLDHINFIKIPAVPIPDQLIILESLKDYEYQIQQQQSKIKSASEIIDNEIVNTFKLDLVGIKREQNNIFRFANPVDLSFRNMTLRGSSRWNKIYPLQNVMYKNNPHISRLGKYVISTRNGWSPACKDDGTKYGVLGLDGITHSGEVIFDNLKFTNQHRNNIEGIIVKEKDLYLSRGNTVDLVGLASVVSGIIEDLEVIFPDLCIRVEVDEESLSKRYLTYVINSIIGRLYFKYCSKGKNLTMAKITSADIRNFYLPIPPIQSQLEVVERIKTQLDAQKIIRKELLEISQKRDILFEKSLLV